MVSWLRFEQVECLNGFMALVKHSLLSIASTPSEVVKQVLASIESQEVFNSKESLGTLGICRVCIISSIGERQVRRGDRKALILMQIRFKLKNGPESRRKIFFRAPSQVHSRFEPSTFPRIDDNFLRIVHFAQHFDLQ